MIAEAPEIARSGIVFATTHAFPSLDDLNETGPTR